MDWWASPEDAQAHFKVELFRDWGFAAARARAEALIEALPGSTFGKKTQARALSKKDQENMIARSNRALASALNPTPPPRPLARRKVCPGGVLRGSPFERFSAYAASPTHELV